MVTAMLSLPTENELFLAVTCRVSVIYRAGGGNHSTWQGHRASVTLKSVDCKEHFGCL